MPYRLLVHTWLQQKNIFETKQNLLLVIIELDPFNRYCRADIPVTLTCQFTFASSIFLKDRRKHLGVYTHRRSSSYVVCAFDGVVYGPNEYEIWWTGPVHMNAWPATTYLPFMCHTNIRDYLIPKFPLQKKKLIHLTSEATPLSDSIVFSAELSEAWSVFLWRLMALMIVTNLTMPML
jgi:hypothetical protein